MTSTGPLPPIASIIAAAAVLPPSMLEVMTGLATKDGSDDGVNRYDLRPASAICFKGRVTPLASAAK